MRMKRLIINNRRNHVPAMLLSCLILLTSGSCFAYAAPGNGDTSEAKTLQTESENADRSEGDSLQDARVRADPAVVAYDDG